MHQRILPARAAEGGGDEGGCEGQGQPGAPCLGRWSTSRRRPRSARCSTTSLQSRGERTSFGSRCERRVRQPSFGEKVLVASSFVSIEATDDGVDGVTAAPPFRFRQ